MTHRNDDIADRLRDDVICRDTFLEKQPKYHRRCRNTYTNKKSVDQKKRAKTLNNELEDKNQCAPHVTRSSSSTREFTKVCFVCGKERDRKGERKLILVATKDREDTILRKAKELDDFAMLHMIQGHGECCTDLIANDFRYHKSCLTLYLLKSRPSSTEQDQPIDSEQRVDEYERAFKETVSKVEGKLLNENTVFFVSQLRDMVRQGLSDRQVNHAIQKSLNQLVRQLENYFGDKIIIVPLVGTSRLVCSSSLSLSTVLSEVKQLKGKLEEWEYLDEEDDEPDEKNGDRGRDVHVQFQRESFITAKAIRRQVKEIRPQDEADDAGNLDLDISYQAAKKLVPTDLYNHLSWMLHDVPFDVGPDGCVPLSQKQHEQVLNIGQDVIAGMSTIPTPKQVGTALHIMKQTRSKDTVTLLNRFGNGIGYHDAQRYISTMASRAEGQLQEKGYFIPENISQ